MLGRGRGDLLSARSRKEIGLPWLEQRLYAREKWEVTWGQVSQALNVSPRYTVASVGQGLPTKVRDTFVQGVANIFFGKGQIVYILGLVDHYDLCLNYSSLLI